MTKFVIPSAQTEEEIFYRNNVSDCIGLARERCRRHGKEAGEKFFADLHNILIEALHDTNTYPDLFMLPVKK